jgi:molybdopterin converting factor small subunit
MTRVLLPTVLRTHSDGQSVVEVNAINVGEALLELTRKYPSLRDPLLDEQGQLRNHINVFVNNDNIRDRDQQETQVDPRDEIVIVPALAGG